MTSTYPNLREFAHDSHAESRSAAAGKVATSNEGLQPAIASAESPEFNCFIAINNSTFNCVHYSFSLGDSNTKPYIVAVLTQKDGDMVGRAFGLNRIYNTVVSDFRGDTKTVRGYDLKLVRLEEIDSRTWAIRLEGSTLASSARV